MADRELYWGAASDSATEYRTRDSDPNGGGDFIVAERSDGSQILLQWDDTAGEWVAGGPVNLNGNALTDAAGVSHAGELADAADTASNPLTQDLDFSSNNASNVGALDADVLNKAAYPEKYGAVGDGSTDDQTAINSLFANNEVCVFQPNTTYFVGGTVSVLTSNRLIVIPESTTIQADLDTITSNRVVEIGDGTNSVSDVRVVGGGTIDGQSSAPGSGSAIIEDEGGAVNIHDTADALVSVDVTDAREYGVEVSQSTNVTVEDCTIDGAGNDGVSVSDGSHAKYGSLGASVSEDIHIINCYATRTEDSGFETDDGPVDVSFEQCVSDGSFTDGFVCHTHTDEVPPEDVTFDNCTAKNCDRYGFKLDAHETPANDVNYVITNCTAKKNGSNGISIQPGVDGGGEPVSGIKISDTDVAENESYGMFVWTTNAEVSDISIVNCHFRENNRTGLTFVSGGDPLEDISVSNCHAWNNYQGSTSGAQRRSGISVWSTAGGAENITISNCRCHDDQSTKTQEYGIYRDSADYCIYTGNNIRGNVNSGFGGTLGTNSVEDNNIT